MAEIPILPSDDLAAKLRSLKPGDVAILENVGTEIAVFSGGAYVSDKPGTAALPITLKARTPGKCIVRGSTPTRTDALGLLRCHWWRIEGVVFMQATRNGLQIGTCEHISVNGCVSRMNGVTGIMCGNSSWAVLADNECYLNVAEHGIYASGKPKGVRILRNKLFMNGKSGCQMNNQGSGGTVDDALVENNQIWGNGVHGAAGINLIGVVNSKVQGNTIHDNVASGIAMSGGCNGNLLCNNEITFRAGSGRQCITDSEVAPTVNTLVGNIVQMGKSTVPAIEAKGTATFIQTNNLILPVAVPVIATPTPDPLVGPVLPP